MVVEEGLAQLSESNFNRLFYGCNFKYRNFDHCLLGSYYC